MKVADNKIFKVMELAIKYIGKLKEEELDKLLAGEYAIALKEVSKKPESKGINEKNDWSKQINILVKATSREEATTYIKSLKLTNEKLISLGQALGLVISKGTKKDRMINSIVEIAVGERLKVDGLRRGIIK